MAADKLGSGPRNAFYDRLNQLLDEIDFDRTLENAPEPFYEKTGRKGLPPGVYFRMIFVGYFEDISSQRGIAWRCEDSRSLARFLGYAPGEATPDHSTLSLTRERLPMELHTLAFELILSAAKTNGLLKGKTIGVDATDLEANASMKSIVRKDNGNHWREYLRKLYEEETGISAPDNGARRRGQSKAKGSGVFSSKSKTKGSGLFFAFPRRDSAGCSIGMLLDPDVSGCILTALTDEGLRYGVRITTKVFIAKQQIGRCLDRAPSLSFSDKPNGGPRCRQSRSLFGA
ncbi:hypothetical protein V7x_27700 [Crateriforma conspicua]|uniref:Transposase InsH N-terminal domain-containing protein n=1 Tax=Crateriforma conspicua TaxID=2527996 RepID=A0A5C6FW02_9PLAN|nr:transposase [Crateriforma conspicua]TWU67197.1 hypothetical protein V7x_27700 [Crateriforma conspicua]